MPTIDSSSINFSDLISNSLSSEETSKTPKPQNSSDDKVINHKSIHFIEDSVEIKNLKIFYKEKTTLNTDPYIHAPHNQEEKILFCLTHRNINAQKSTWINAQKLAALKPSRKFFFGLTLGFFALFYSAPFLISLFSLEISINNLLLLMTASYSLFSIFAIKFYSSKFKKVKNELLEEMLISKNIQDITLGAFLYNKFKSENENFNNFLLVLFSINNSYLKPLYLLPIHQIEDCFSDKKLSLLLSSLIHTYEENKKQKAKPHIPSAPRIPYFY